ncbi:hypothetical protein C8F01DRAFT_997960, partial [Mycena amicta]
ATSTAVKHVFSQGHQLLVFTRNRLTGTSICKYMCFGSWSGRDLISTEDVVRWIGGKTLKGKGSKRKLSVGAGKDGETCEQPEAGSSKKSRKT